MDPFMNTVNAKLALKAMGSEMYRIKSTQLLSRFADLHENSHLFVCPTTAFFVQK